MKQFKFITTLVLILLMSAATIQAQFVGPAPLIVPGNNYAFAYSNNGLASGLTTYGLYFKAGTTTPGFEFRGAAGAKLLNVQSIAAGNREPGDITFGNTGSLIVNPNRYAFRFSLTNSYGLFFNATGFAYEFRTADASPVFSVGANSGDIAFDGTATIGAVPQDNALTEVLVKDASGLVHYRDAATLGGGGGLWTASGSNISYDVGNVSIGSPTPGVGGNFKLDVGGNVRIGDTSTAEQDILYRCATGAWQVGTNPAGNGTDGNHFYIYDGSYRLSVNKGTGYVGIGSNSPTSRLDVLGTNGATNNIRSSLTNGDYVNMARNDANAVIFTNNSEPLLLNHNGGNVAIGTTTDISKLTVQTGNGYGLLHTNGAVQVGTYVSSAGGWFGTANDYDLHLFTNNFPPQVTLQSNTGNLGIGTLNPQSKLAVNGTITCKEVDVTLAGFPDYVFDKDYELMSLSKLSEFIETNGHLPNMPTEAEVIENGVGLGALNVKLVEKVEELTLHLIEKDNALNEQKALIQAIQMRLTNLEESNR